MIVCNNKSKLLTKFNCFFGKMLKLEGLANFPKSVGKSNPVKNHKTLKALLFPWLIRAVSLKFNLRIFFWFRNTFFEVASQRKLILVRDENIKFHSCNAVYLIIVATFKKICLTKLLNHFMSLVPFYFLKTSENYMFSGVLTLSAPMHLRKLH